MCTLRIYLKRIAFLLGAMLVSVTTSAWAQLAPDLRAVVPADAAPESMSQLFAKLGAGEKTISVPGAAWLQLQFSEVHLGPDGVLTITDASGEYQTFSQAQIDAWGGMSATFNGSELRVSLRQGATEPVSARIKDIIIGLPASAVSGGEFVTPHPLRNLLGPDIKRFISAPDDLRGLWKQDAVQCAAVNTSNDSGTICGANDDRVASDDPRVGRIRPGGATGWLMDGGRLVTAGHANLGAPSVPQTLEFNVPTSQADGTPVAPPVRDQYRVIAASVVSENTGVGNDWAVFEVLPNTQSGLMPAAAQGATFQVSNTDNPAQVRVTGYGVDGPPPSFGSGPNDNKPRAPRNAQSQIQQTHAGPLIINYRYPWGTAYLGFEVDIQHGNSGGPVIDEVSNSAIGIVTHGGCGLTGGYNKGTSFRNAALWTAVNTATEAGYPITEDWRLAPTLVQSSNPSRAKDLLVVAKEDNKLCRWSSDNSGRRWEPSECFGEKIVSAPAMIESRELWLEDVESTYQDLVEHFPLRVVARSAHSLLAYELDSESYWWDGFVTSGAGLYAPALLDGNIIWDDSEVIKGTHKHVELVTQEGSNGLAHYSRDPRYAWPPKPWQFEQSFAPNAISAPALIKSSFQETSRAPIRNYELVVREIVDGASRLCHWYRPNQWWDSGGPWQKSQCFANQISSPPAMIQSDYKQPAATHGNFEVVVRRTINGESKLYHYWRDNSGDPYRWKGPTASFGENVTSAPAFIQSTYREPGARHGNFEVLTWETKDGKSQLCRYWRDNSDPSQKGSLQWKRDPTSCFAGRDDAAEPINNLVAFADNQLGYLYIPGETQGCPELSKGQVYAGKFRFNATLSNISGHTLTDLGMEIAELTDKNWLLTPDAQLLGAGDWLAMPFADGYADHELGPRETMSTSFTICVKTQKPFRFFVNVTGIPLINGK